MIIEFGEYLPDLNTFGMQAVTQAVNVEPLIKGYRSMPEYSQISVGTAAGGAILGAFEASYQLSGGTLVTANFAGTASKIYYMTSAGIGSLSDVSRVSGYSVDVSTLERWDFTQYGSKVLACGGTSSLSWFPVQSWTLGSSSVFADIAAAPGARTIGVVRDFVVVGHTYDATDGYRPTRIRWCAFGDETTWAVNAATQADIQDFSDAAGPVRQIVSGDVGVIFFDRAIYAMEYAGPPIAFRFRKITTAFGLLAQGLAVEFGGLVYCLTQSGFKAISPDGTIQNIGAGKVDATVESGISYQNASSAVDQSRGLIFFLLNQGGPCYVYAVNSGKWATYDSTLGDLNIGAELIQTARYDKAFRCAGLWSTVHKLYQVGQGNPPIESPILGRIDTAELQFNPQGWTTTQMLRPIVSGATLSTANVYVLRRNSQRESLSATGALAYNAAQDYFQGNVTAKYHAFRFESRQKNGNYLGIDISKQVPRSRR